MRRLNFIKLTFSHPPTIAPAGRGFRVTSFIIYQNPPPPPTAFIRRLGPSLAKHSSKFNTVDNMNVSHTVDDIDTVLLKVKLEESALVINVNKNRCSLKSINLGVN